MQPKYFYGITLLYKKQKREAIVLFNKNKKRSSISPYTKHEITRGDYEKERERPIATIAVFERNSGEKRRSSPN